MPRLYAYFEDELTTSFGPKASLGEVLRFPIFVGELTPLGEARFGELQAELPKRSRDFLTHFESGLDDSITNDQRYEFRITLVPQVGPKQSADMSLTFVRESDLNDEEREALVGTGSYRVRRRSRTG